MYSEEHRLAKQRAATRRFAERHPDRVARSYSKHHYKKQYGITVEERDALLASQGGTCRTCPKVEDGWSRGWAVDHCHTTGKVRGVLCKHCNLALGHARDDAALLRRLADYLEGGL